MPTSPNSAPITIHRPALALELPDPAPLRAAMAAVHQCRGKLATLADEKTAHEAEIQKHIATSDTADEAELNRIAGKRVRLEMLPNLQERLNKEHASHGLALFPLITEFSDSLRAAMDKERAAWYDIAEAHIKPLCPDAPTQDGGSVNRARHLVSRFPWRTTVPNLYTLVEQWRTPLADECHQRMTMGGQFRASVIDDAFRRANLLLDLHAKIAKAGCYFHHPADVPAVEAQLIAEATAAKENAVASEKEKAEKTRKNVAEFERQREEREQQKEQREKEEEAERRRAWDEQTRGTGKIYAP